MLREAWHLVETWRYSRPLPDSVNSVRRARRLPDSFRQDSQLRSFSMRPSPRLRFSRPFKTATHRALNTFWRKRAFKPACLTLAQNMPQPAKARFEASPRNRHHWPKLILSPATNLLHLLSKNKRPESG